MFRSSMLSIIILLTVSACSMPGEPISNNISGYDNGQLCQSYLAEYSTLYSKDAVLLSESQRQYLIALSATVNERGLTKRWCENNISEVD